MHYLTCGVSSLLHSVNLIVFTLLLVHLILRISPHHSHHLRSHHLSLHRTFTPDLKLISFTNPFLHSHCYSFQTALTCTVLKGHWRLFVLVSLFWLQVLDKAEYSAFESMLNSPIVSYHIISRRCHKTPHRAHCTTSRREWRVTGRFAPSPAERLNSFPTYSVKTHMIISRSILLTTALRTIFQCGAWGAVFHDTPSRYVLLIMVSGVGGDFSQASHCGPSSFSQTSFHPYLKKCVHVVNAIARSQNGGNSTAVWPLYFLRQRNFRRYKIARSAESLQL